MDPQAALCRIADSLICQERGEAVEALEDLAAWIRSGGFLPKVGETIIGDVSVGYFIQKEN